MYKILIVDDEEEICAFLAEFFRDCEYDVYTAFNGRDALLSVEREKPHVVLLDITMPGIDGLSVLRTIKERNPGIRVIMVTAVETEDKMTEAFKLGADNYITKPLSLEYLEQDVREKINSMA